MSIMEDITKIGKFGIVERVKNSTDYIPTGLFIKEGCIIGGVLLQFNDEPTKREAYKTVGNYCAMNGIDQIALLTDSYMRKVDSEEKSDALVIVYVDFKDLNNNEFLIIPYEVKGTIVDFITPDDCPDSFGGQILGCLLVGFSTSLIYKLVTDGQSSSLEDVKKKFFENYLHNIKDHPELVQSIVMGFGE